MILIYGIINIETKLILDVQLFGQSDTDPLSAFSPSLHEKHDLSVVTFLIGSLGIVLSLSAGIEP